MRNGQQKQEAKIAAGGLLWPVTHTPLKPTTVEIFFWGIMGFRFNPESRECEIGFHSGSPTHDLKIIVLKNNLEALYFGEKLQLTKVIELGTSKNKNNVLFYQVAGELNRSDKKADQNDFRWLIDLEHPDFYGSPLTLKSRVYRKRLRVKHGTFFNAVRTESTFDIEGGPLPAQDIFLSSAVGTRFDLDAGECVELVIEGTDVLKGKACQDGSTYQIFFVNNCFRLLDGEVKKCASSDFHLNWDVVDIPHNQRFEIHLKKWSKAKVDALEQRFGNGPFERFPFNNDEAPCMGVGFGQGGGFPEFPPG